MKGSALEKFSNHPIAKTSVKDVNLTQNGVSTAASNNKCMEYADIYSTISTKSLNGINPPSPVKIASQYNPFQKDCIDRRMVIVDTNETLSNDFDSELCNIHSIKNKLDQPLYDISHINKDEENQLKDKFSKLFEDAQITDASSNTLVKIINDVDEKIDYGDGDV